MMRFARLAAALLAALPLTVGHAAAQDDHDAHEDLVRLEPAVQEEFGITVAEAGPGVIVHVLELPGEVRPDADRLAHLVPRFGGIVTAVRAAVGDRVESGRVLATIESDGSLADYDLRTRIGGTVIARHLTLGEAVGRDDVVFVVADLDTVWVDVTVYQADLDRVRPGQEAVVGTGREPAAVAVPEAALQDFEGRTVVFTAGADGFRPRPVKTGGRGGGLVEIAAGLAAGERYVVAGAFTLKAELGKNAFGDGHGH